MVQKSPLPSTPASGLSLRLVQHHPKHYCGVFGIHGHPNAAELTYYGLYALQHRGQESAGIVTTDGKTFNIHRGMGLVPQVFTSDILHRLVGHTGIGHTRYSTTGSSNIVNAQPLTVDCAKGRIAIGRFLQRFPNYQLSQAPVRGGRARFRGFLQAAFSI